MSATEAILYALVSLGSSFACYRIGRDEEKKKWLAWFRAHYPNRLNSRNFPE
jgi:hypothetical protein